VPALEAEILALRQQLTETTEQLKIARAESDGDLTTIGKILATLRDTEAKLVETTPERIMASDAGVRTMMDWDNIAHVRIHARAAEERIKALEQQLAETEAQRVALQENLTEVQQQTLMLAQRLNAIVEALDVPEDADEAAHATALRAQVAALTAQREHEGDFETPEAYSAYLKEREQADKPAYVSQAFLRASNATALEFAEVDEAMGTPIDGTDEDAQVFRLQLIRSSLSLRAAVAPLIAQWREEAGKLLKHGWLQSIRRDAIEKCAEQLAHVLGETPIAPRLK